MRRYIDVIVGFACGFVVYFVIFLPFPSNIFDKNGSLSFPLFFVTQIIVFIIFSLLYISIKFAFRKNRQEPVVITSYVYSLGSFLLGGVIFDIAGFIFLVWALRNVGLG